MKRVFKFMNGFFTGALVGSLVMLLLTPESGEDVRNSIKEKFQSLKNEINEAAQVKRIELEAELERLRR